MGIFHFSQPLHIWFCPLHSELESLLSISIQIYHSLLINLHSIQCIQLMTSMLNNQTQHLYTLSKHWEAHIYHRDIYMNILRLFSSNKEWMMKGRLYNLMYFLNTISKEMNIISNNNIGCRYILMDIFRRKHYLVVNSKVQKCYIGHNLIIKKKLGEQNINSKKQ